MYTAFLAQRHLDLDEFHNRERSRTPANYSPAMPTATRRLPGPSLEPSRLTTLARSKGRRPSPATVMRMLREHDEKAASA
jgi:hypothetical protein